MGIRLNQTQLTGVGDGFCAPFDLEFVEDVTIVPFDGAERDKQTLTLALAQYLFVFDDGLSSY